MAPNAEPEKDFPWWLVILAVIGLWFLYKMLADDFYAGALRVLSKGLVVTLSVAVVAYLGACGIGLGLAVMGMSKWVVLRQAARILPVIPVDDVGQRPDLAAIIKRLLALLKGK